MLSKSPLVSVCIPTYNSAKIIGQTLASLKNQTYQNFEVVVSDDCSKDKTIKLIWEFGFKHLIIQRNKKNLGYGQNLQNLGHMANGQIIFLLAHDDLLDKNAIFETVNAFLTDHKVGVVTRPYYWFDSDPLKPIRHIPPIRNDKTVFVDILKSPEKIIPIIESVGQLSGLAYRRDLFTNFHHETFPAHVYPFMEILKKAKCAFIPHYTVAVGTRSSQTRLKPEIYKISPTLSWINMLKKIFNENEFKETREIAEDHMAQNYLGFIQLKNYGGSRIILYREILILIFLRIRNLLSVKFWFYVLWATLIPSCVSRPLVDRYKSVVVARRLKGTLKIGIAQ